MNLHVETRSLTLRRHVEEFLRKTATSWESFTADVVGAYHKRVKPELREIEFRTEGDAWKSMRANAQIFKRMVHEDVRLPADIEEAIVFALPDAEQEALLCELAARYGLLAVPMAKDAASRHDGFQLLTQFIRKAGQGTHALTQIFDDGDITAADEQHIPEAIRALQEWEAAAADARCRLQRYQLTKGKGKRHA